MSTAGHREIDHTADLGFELWAPTIEEFFAEGIRALGELCYELDAVRPLRERRLTVIGSNPEERLVRWLHEAYLMVETDLWLSAGARGVSLAADGVEGTLLGEPFDARRHTIHTEIKAITYHGLRIEQEGTLWRATVVVDV